MFTDRRQPLSLRSIDRMGERSQHDSMPSVAGMSVDTAPGNPVYVADKMQQRYVTARIIGIAYKYDGRTPLLDYNGRYQYQWIEEQRYIDGNGFPAWKDADAVPMDDFRGSINLGDGQYLNLAHEANGAVAIAGDHVIMWAGVLNQENVARPGQADWEHVFYRGDTLLPVELKSDLYPGQYAEFYPLFGSPPEIPVNAAGTPDTTQAIIATDYDGWRIGEGIDSRNPGAPPLIAAMKRGPRGYLRRCPSGSGWAICGGFEWAWAVAKSDWTESGKPGDWPLTQGSGSPYVIVKLCADQFGTTPAFVELNCFLPRQAKLIGVVACDIGDRDPQVYGPNATNPPWPDYPGDVIKVHVEITAQSYRVLALSPYLGERCGAIKLWHGSLATIPYGWHLCDGSLGTPDLRGLFVRCVETPVDTLWDDGATIGAGNDGVGGNLIGIASTRLFDAQIGGAQPRVTQLENAPAYLPAAQPNLGEAVVCPPCYVLAYIMRAK